MPGSEMSDEALVAHWQNVRSAVTLVGRRIDRRMADAGLPAQWFPVLRLLHDAEDHRLPMSALAREVSMTSGGFTKLADRMAREGLIDRRGSATDRRVVHAELTDEGVQLARHALGVYLDALRECVLGVVSADELAAMAGTLGTLRVAYEASPDDVFDDVAPVRDANAPDRRRRQDP